MERHSEAPLLKAAWDRAVFPPKGWSGDKFFLSRYNHIIRYAHAPAEGEERGTIILTHGYGENIDLYYETIKEYQRQGFSVWAMDWHGHGKSGRGDPENPRKPQPRDILTSREDLHDFATAIVQRDKSKPLILSTHSMGGHISMMYLEKYKNTFDGAVMSAPMLGVYDFHLPQFLRPALRGAFKAASWLGLGSWSLPDYQDIAKTFNRLAFGYKILPEGEPETPRNEYNGEIRRMQQGEETDNPTVDWINATFLTTDHLMRENNLRSVRTPILIGSAGMDMLVDNKAHERAVSLIPGARLVKIDNAQHGLWFENNKKYGEWMGHITRFLNETVAAFTRKKTVAPAAPAAEEDVLPAPATLTFPIPLPAPVLAPSALAA